MGGGEEDFRCVDGYHNVVWQGGQCLIFSSPEQSSLRAIVLSLALALALASTNVKVLR